MNISGNSTNKDDESNNLYQENSEMKADDIIDAEKKLDDIDINSDNEIIFCGCCQSACRIKFKSKTKLNIKCENAWKILDTSTFNQNYIKSISLIGDLKNFFCTSHQNIYQIYCKHCKMNQCKDCKTENDCEKHLQIDFKEEKIKINYLNSYIINNYNPKMNNKEENNFYRLLKAIILTYEQYPNIKLYKSIESACELIEFLKQGKNENENIVQLKEGISIKDYPGLRKKKRKLGKAFNIYLNNMNFKNLKLLSKVWLKDNSELLKLTLAGNNLTNIKFLTIPIMKNLQLLDLSRNKLGNKNIKYISDLQCPNLEELYLHHNIFTDYNIFNKISKKFKLKVFYIVLSN